MSYRSFMFLPAVQPRAQQTVRQGESSNIAAFTLILMNILKDETEATPYMLDLLHDRNTEVQRVCDATLQMIGEISPEWSQKLMAEKFR